MVGERLAEGAQQFLETVPVGARQRPFGGRQDLLERQPQQLVDQRVLAGEPAVDRADAHAGPRGDLLHAGVGAGLAEHLARGVEDAVIVAHGVAPCGGGAGVPWSAPCSLAPCRSARRLVPRRRRHRQHLGVTPAHPAAPSAGRARRRESAGPASAASTRPAAITANPVV